MVCGELMSSAPHVNIVNGTMIDQMCCFQNKTTDIK